jgi:hypothetical protein
MNRRAASASCCGVRQVRSSVKTHTLVGLSDSIGASTGLRRDASFLSQGDGGAIRTNEGRAGPGFPTTALTASDLLGWIRLQPSSMDSRPRSIHWRFWENVCALPRSEVSPKARKKGDGGRVVEIGALNHAAEHPTPELESTVVDALADALLQVRSPDPR